MQNAFDPKKTCNKLNDLPSQQVAHSKTCIHTCEAYDEKLHTIWSMCTIESSPPRVSLTFAINV